MTSTRPIQEAEHLRKGQFYNIINLGNNLALSMPKTKRYTKDKPNFCEHDPSDSNQLWMVEQVQPDRYEIVHALSTLVLECISGTNVCKLQVGKQKANQLFILEVGSQQAAELGAMNPQRGAVNLKQSQKREKTEERSPSEKKQKKGLTGGVKVMVEQPKRKEEEQMSRTPSRMRKETSTSMMRRRQMTQKTNTYINLRPHRKLDLKFRFKDRGNSHKYLFCDASKANPAVKFMEIDSLVSQVYLSSLWQLVPVKESQNELLSNLCEISSFRSGHVLDVPEGSDKPGGQVIQKHCNFRFNQKWIFRKIQQVNGQSYYEIFNAKTGYCLDIKGHSTKEGTPVIQWTSNHEKWQIWRLEEQGKRTYLIRSAYDRTLLLGVKDNSLKEEAEIVTTKEETESFWVIHGNIPH